MPRVRDIYIVIACFLLSVSSRILNVTIDDTLGDERTGQAPQYAPDNWIPRSPGAPCGACTAQPDATFIYNGTWHDRSTFANQVPSTVTMSFKGTRIYVFFILFNNIGTVNLNTRLQFYIDGSSNPAKEFVHFGDPAGEKYYLYDQVVFDSQTLPPGDHTLRISSYATETDGSVALFDRAVYTTEIDDDPVPHIIAVSPSQSSAQIDVAKSPQSPAQTVNLSPAQTVGLAPSQSVSPADPASSQRSLRTPFAAATPAEISQSPTQPVYPTSSQIRSGTDGHPFRLDIVIGCALAGATVLVLLLAAGCWRHRAMRGITAPVQLDIDAPLFSPRAGASESPRSTDSLRDNSAQLCDELERMREELARVRRLAEPPEYTDSSVSS